MAEKTVYIVEAHDESWGFRGDYIIGVYENEELAKKCKEHLEANLILRDGDYVCIRKEPVMDYVTLPDVENLDICDLMHSNLFYEEEP